MNKMYFTDEESTEAVDALIGEEEDEDEEVDADEAFEDDEDSDEEE